MIGNSKGLVSVIIPNHNYGKYVGKAIESVLAQSYKNIEIIVIDNGSTDDSRNVILSYEGKIRFHFQNDLGQAESRNTGLKMASGSYIAFLDADDLWHEEKIAKQIQQISSVMELVFTRVGAFRENTSHILMTLPITVKNRFKDAYIESPNVGIVPAGESSVLLTRELANKVGYFDNHLGSATGRDYFRRCSEKTDFGVIEETLAYYRLHANNMSKNIDYMLNNSLNAHKKALRERMSDLSYSQVTFSLWAIYWSSLKSKAAIHEYFGAVTYLFKFIGIQSKLTYMWWFAGAKVNCLT